MKKWMIACVSLCLALALLLPSMGSAAIVGAVVGEAVEPLPMEPEDEKIDSAEEFLGHAHSKDLRFMTDLILNVHAYYSHKAGSDYEKLLLEDATAALEEAELNLKKGIGTAAELEVLKAAKAQAEALYQREELELLKIVAAIRAATDLDIRELDCSQDEFFLILKPSDVTLLELKSWALVHGQELENPDLYMEQAYIDMQLYYSQIGLELGEYEAVVQNHAETARAVIMGNATNEEMKIAARAVKTARANMFYNISAYSQLLYTINEYCGGQLADRAQTLTKFVGNWAQS